MYEIATREDEEGEDDDGKLNRIVEVRTKAADGAESQPGQSVQSVRRRRDHLRDSKIASNVNKNKDEEGSRIKSKAAHEIDNDAEDEYARRCEC